MYSANQTITLNTILCCDPLVSDTACQIRAIYLVYLCHTLCKTNGLSPGANQFIIDCEFLSKDIETDYHRDLPGYVETQNFKHNIQRVDSNGTILTAISVAQMKSRVASTSIAFINRYHKSSDEIMPVAAHISSSHVRINVLPCFLSTQMMLRCLQKERFLLIVHLKRVLVNNGQKAIIGSESVCYRYEGNALLALSTIPSLLDEPAVTINMYSSLVINPSKDYTHIEPLFSCPDFSDFVAGFRQLDIAKIIMMCAAAHSQYSGSVKLPANDFIPGTFTDTSKISEVPFDLEHCSKAQFQRLHHTARHYGLLSEAASAGKGDIFNPIRTNHIYISSLAKLIASTTACNDAFALREHSIFKPSAAAQALTSDHQTLTPGGSR